MQFLACVGHSSGGAQGRRRRAAGLVSLCMSKCRRPGCRRRPGHRRPWGRRGQGHQRKPDGKKARASPTGVGSIQIGGRKMAVQADTSGQPAAAGQRWYARSPDEVAAALGVHPETGLSAQRAAELLKADGPNALPEEKPKPGWRRLLEQYGRYMQFILGGAAVVSLVIKEWSTGVLLLVLTLLNAVIGLGREGKGER